MDLVFWEEDAQKNDFSKECSRSLEISRAIWGSGCFSEEFVAFVVLFEWVSDLCQRVIWIIGEGSSNVFECVPLVVGHQRVSSVFTFLRCYMVMKINESSEWGRVFMSQIVRMWFPVNIFEIVEQLDWIWECSHILIWWDSKCVFDSLRCETCYWKYIECLEFQLVQIDYFA